MNTPHPPHAGPLPNELRAVEAMLASLAPSGDRLDHEQLWFEMGKRAAMEATPASNSVWIVAGSSALSAAMAIAATLLVMFWTQTPAQSVERIRVADRTAMEVAVQEPKAGTNPPVPPLAEPPAERRDSEPPSTSLARWNANPPRGSRAAQLERIALLLHHDADYREPVSGATRAANRQPSEGFQKPPTYYQQRQDLLGDQASRGSRPDLSNAPVLGT